MRNFPREVVGPGTPKEVVKRQILPSLIMIVMFVGGYFLTVLVPPGPLTWAISSAALFMIWVTVVARVNDMSSKDDTLVTHFRKFSLVCAGCGAILICLQVVTDFNTHPTWGETMFRVGIAGMLMTTGNMPPWWKYITCQPDRKP